MAEVFVNVSQLWNDNDSWIFPVLVAGEENSGKVLIEDGKIVLDIGGSGGRAEAVVAPPAVTEFNDVMKEVGALPPAGRKRRNGDGDGGGDKDHEQHIMTERERMKKMSDMFANLRSLVPDTHHLRADGSGIVDEVVEYIKKLQKKLKYLETKKEILPKGRNANPTDCDDASITSQPKQEAVAAEKAAGGSSSEQAVALASPIQPFSGPEFPAQFKSFGSENVVVNICGKDAHISVCYSKKPGPLPAISFALEKYKIEVVSAHVSFYHDTHMYMIHAREMGAQQSPEVEEIFKQAATEITAWLIN